MNSLVASRVRSERIGYNGVGSRLLQGSRYLTNVRECHNDRESSGRDNGVGSHYGVSRSAFRRWRFDWTAGVSQGRFEAETLRRFFSPVRRAKRSAAIGRPSQRLQFSFGVDAVDELEPPPAAWNGPSGERHVAFALHTAP